MSVERMDRAALRAAAKYLLTMHEKCLIMLLQTAKTAPLWVDLTITKWLLNIIY